MAKNDLDPEVQLQLGFSLGQTPEARGAAGLAARGGKFRGAATLTREAVITSLYPTRAGVYGTNRPGMGRKCRIRSRRALLEGFLAESVLSTHARRTKSRALLDVASVAAEWQQKAILDGMGVRTAREEQKDLLHLRARRPGPNARQAKSLAGASTKLAQILTWPEQPGYVPPPFVPPLSADEQKEYNLGHDLFSVTCAACHQPTGLGARGIAPPLVGSEWVLGSNERLIRIVLKGLQGPIKAAGVSFNSNMPSWASFNDEQLAGILTYIRRDWEQGAPPIKPAMVKAIREVAAKHDGAWTGEELTKIP